MLGVSAIEAPRSHLSHVFVADESGPGKLANTESLQLHPRRFVNYFAVQTVIPYTWKNLRLMDKNSDGNKCADL